MKRVLPAPEYNIIGRTQEFLNIKDNPALADKAQTAIIRMLVKVDEATQDKRNSSKKLKDALVDHEAALKRLLITRRNLSKAAAAEQADLPYFALTHGEDEDDIQRIMNAGWIKGEILETSFDKKIKTELEFVTALLENRSKAKPTRIDIPARAAAMTALRLLQICGQPAIPVRKSE